MLTLPIIQEIVDDAEISSFVVPTTLKNVGDTVSVSVTVENLGTTTRSFWIGLSFKGPNAGKWPNGWVDVSPLESSTIVMIKRIL